MGARDLYSGADVVFEVRADDKRPHKISLLFRDGIERYLAFATVIETMRHIEGTSSRRSLTLVFGGPAPPHAFTSLVRPLRRH